jgi:hypothetical protein
MIDGIEVVEEGHSVRYREGRHARVEVMLLFKNLMSDSSAVDKDRTLYNSRIKPARSVRVHHSQA